jgi:hypothetical protein
MDNTEKKCRVGRKHMLCPAVGEAGIFLMVEELISQNEKINE